MDAPHSTKPAHGYGQPYGAAAEDRDWAGPGFTVVPSPETLEPPSADAA